MIWSAKQLVILSGGAIAWGLLATWLALVAPPASRIGLVTRRHCRPHPPVQEQEPPAWLLVLARAVLVLALAALGLAMLLAGDASP